MKRLSIAVISALMVTPALAQDASGDAAAGEQQFNRQCVACHVVRDADGNTLAGRNGKAGPNLYGIANGLVAQQNGFRYGDGLKEAAEAGVNWSEENFIAYVQDPTKWLRATLDNRRARSKMAYRVRSETQAADIFAYLATVAPAND